MYEHVLSPLKIGKVEVRNRVVLAAHGTMFNRFSPGRIHEQLISYAEARAKGGVGLIIQDNQSGIHPTAGIPPLIEPIADYRKYTDRIHAHGAKVFHQLMHRAEHQYVLDAMMVPQPPWSASANATVETGAVGAACAPHVMDHDDIKEIIRCFADAAAQSREGGFDGVEIHGGHGYLPASFLSPLSNRRTDEYGGSRKNRMRFLVQLLESVRERVGDFAICLRISASDMVEGGLEPGEVAEVAKTVEPLIDCLNISLGNYPTPAWHKMVATMETPPGYQLPYSGIVAKAVSIPTIVIGRILSIPQANEIIAAGVADMVAMVRAHMADPELVNKAASGRDAETRPCISCNQGCIGGIPSVIGQVRCTVNAETGMEFALQPIAPAPSKKTIMIVGGGPAGLEAARTAALRGHTVSLYEEKGALGGALNLARNAPYRDTIGSIADWLADDIARLGVEVHLGGRVDRALVEEENPDVVIVATGAVQRRDGFQAERPAYRLPGVELPHVLTVADVMDGKAPSAKTALVYDDVGQYAAIGAAEHLAARGAKVLLLTRFPAIGYVGVLDQKVLQPGMKRLEDLGVEFGLYGRVHEIEPGRASIGTVHTDRKRWVDADVVVMCSGALPRDELHAALKDYPGQVEIVGDAKGPRGMQTAIHEANFLARNL